METHCMSRRCIITTRSLRSTTLKKMSLRVCNLIREPRALSTECTGSSDACAIPDHVFTGVENHEEHEVPGFPWCTFVFFVVKIRAFVIKKRETLAFPPAD